MKHGNERLRLFLQAGLLARSAVLDRHAEGFESARRLGLAVSKLSEANADLKRAAVQVSAAPNVKIHMLLDEMLREIRRATGSARGSGAVMLVDDDPVMTSMLHMVVRPYSREVTAIPNLADARNALSRSRPSAMVVDISLPDGDGRDLLAEIQADPTLEGVPVLVLTGDDSSLLRSECLALGAREVHNKPMDPVALTQAIAVLLGFEERTQLELSGDMITGLAGPAELAERAIAMRENFFTTGRTWSVLAVRDGKGNVGQVADAVREVLGLDAPACRDGKSVLLLVDGDMRKAVKVGNQIRQKIGPGSLVGGTECGNNAWNEVAAVAKRMLILSQGTEEVVVVPASALDRTRPRVVVVDDDPMVAPLVTAALDSKYEVVPLRDGEKLFEALDTMRPTAVILDIGLPGRSGLELLRQLRGSVRHARTPVLLLSSYDSPRQVETGLQAGADDYVTKPFDPLTLQARLRHVLSRLSKQ